MALVRWDPLRDVDSLHGEMNRLFSSFFDTPTTPPRHGRPVARRWVPAMDLVETAEHVVLRADLPGVAEGDVTIEVDQRVLTIAGERKADHDDSQTGFYRLERPTGPFSRALTLPDGVDPAAITAAFADGVLEVRIPKPAAAQPRRVRIDVAGAGTEAIEAEASAPSAAAEASATP